MQLIVNLEADEVEIPYDHSYQLYSGVLALVKVSDPSIASLLHTYNSTSKFSISQLMPGGKRQFTKTGFLGERYIFIISSLDESLIEIFRNALGSSENIKIFDRTFKIHSIIKREISPSSEIINIKTRSPIVLKSDNKYLSKESESIISEALLSNIKRKYVRVKGVDPDIRFIQILNLKQKIIGVKGVKLPAFMLSLTISADINVLRFILTVGLGSKNKLGFGFVEEEKESSLNVL